MDQRVETIIMDEAHLPIFDKVDPTGGLEAKFEDVALRILARLYSSCYVCEFKALLTHDGAGWRPDLAIIDRSWGYWFVVEVEIATHSLYKHVLPQVTAFRDGDYGTETCSAAIARATGVSVDRATTLLRYIPRYVAVVSNQEDAVWASVLAEEAVQYMSIASFARALGPPAYLVKGLLHPAEHSVGFGTALPSLQTIRLPRSDFWRDGTYRVVEANGVADWNCFVDAQVVWLTKQRGLITLPEGAWVQLIAQGNGSLLLRQV